MHFVILQNIYYKQQLVECFILLHIKFSPSGYVIRTWFLKILLRKFCRLFSWTLKVRIRICLSLIGSGLSATPRRFALFYFVSRGNGGRYVLKTYFTFYIFRRPSAITLLDQEKPKHWFSTIFAKKTPQYLYLLKLKRSYFSVGLYTVYIFV